MSQIFLRLPFSHLRPNRGTDEQAPLLFSLQHDKEDLKRTIVITELDFLFFPTDSLFLRLSRRRSRIKMGVGRRDLGRVLLFVGGRP